MDIPIVQTVQNDHFVESTVFELTEELASNYFKTLCSTCQEGQSIHYFDDAENVLVIRDLYPRSEVATYHLLKETEMRISWKLFLTAAGYGVNTTVSQLIGWQPECFTGGNYHVRTQQGAWEIWMRNITENKRDLILDKSIKYNEWVEFTVWAKFSDEDGYFSISIKDSDSFQVFNLIESGPTYVSCKRGPYLKFGSYNGRSSELEVGVKDISVKYR